MAKQIWATPYGNLGNQMFQYMTARSLQQRVPTAELVGARMPVWGIEPETPPEQTGRFSIGVKRHRFPFERVVSLLRDESSIDVFIERPCCRLEYWQEHLDLFRDEFRATGESGGGTGELVVNIRSGDILLAKKDGSVRHGNYIPAPIDLYAQLADLTGLAPVFVGQIESDPYTDALRERFAGAEFISHETELGDFEYLRNSANVLLGVSTYSWLAGWLSSPQTTVYLPAMGLFNPSARPDIDLIPTDDPRYVVLDSDLEQWRGSPEELDALISAPVSSFGFDLSRIDSAPPPGRPPTPAVSVDLVAASRSMADRLSDYKQRVDPTIGDGDEMYGGDLDDYLSVTYSAVAQIGHAMAAFGTTSVGRILDLPSGHGRVMRGLRAAFPEAELTACDINRDGVDFCAERFGAIPVYSDPDPARIPLDGDFDLIWVGSLLTHLDAERCRAFLELFREHLAPGGMLLFSSHGRNAVKRWPSDDPRAAAIAEEYDEHGFGYRDHAGVSGYGTSAFSASWIAEELAGWRDLMLVGYVERGLADHQDLVVVLKTDVHHGQNELLLT